MKKVPQWVAPSDLAGLPGMPTSVKGVRVRAQRERWPSRTRSGRGGGLEYHLASLPPETREAIGGGSDGASTGALPPPAPSPAALTADLTDFLAARRITLTPAELADEDLQRKILCARAVDGADAYRGKGAVIASLAARYHVSPVTIRRWVAEVTSLQTRKPPRITLGEERVEIPGSYAFSPEALACGLSAYAQDMKAGMRAAYSRICALRGEREWRVGDYATFTRIIRKIPPAVWLRIKKGATGFELHGLPKIIRQWTAIPVQSVVCGDQKIFDYVTWDPETDTLIKPGGYFWMDCASRLITGVWIEMGHYNQYTVGNSLREALRYGIPDEIYTDWGKPEGARHIDHIRRSLAGATSTDDFLAMQARYGDIDDYPDHRRAQPGKPWMKPIENIMNLIDARLKAKNLPGFRKRDNQDPWANKEIQETLKRQARQGKLLPIADFITAVFTVVEEHNTAEKKLTEGGSIVPISFFIDGLKRRPRHVYDETTLDYICLPTFDRIPRHSQVHVTIRGEERSYQSHLLSGWKRGKVRISVDPYDREKPAVLTDPATGRFLDLAQPWHVQNPYDPAGIAVKRRRQAELMKWVAEQAKRVKDGFDVYKAPEIAERAVVKVTAATAAARTADAETKIYTIRKAEEKRERDRIITEARTEQEALEREFAAAAREREIDPWSLAEGRDRFCYWLKIKACVDLDKALTEREQEFFTRYPHTADYRVCNDLYEEYGDIYLIGGSQNG